MRTPTAARRCVTTKDYEGPDRRRASEVSPGWISALVALLVTICTLAATFGGVLQSVNDTREAAKETRSEVKEIRDDMVTVQTDVAYVKATLDAIRGSQQRGTP